MVVGPSFLGFKELSNSISGPPDNFFHITSHLEKFFRKSSRIDFHEILKEILKESLKDFLKDLRIKFSFEKFFCKNLFFCVLSVRNGFFGI